MAKISNLWQRLPNCQVANSQTRKKKKKISVLEFQVPVVSLHEYNVKWKEMKKNKKNKNSYMVDH